MIPPQTATEKSSGYDIIALSDPEIVGVKDIPVGHDVSDEKEGVVFPYSSIQYVEYKTGMFISPQNQWRYQGLKTTGPLSDDPRHSKLFDDFHTLIFPRSSVSKYNLSLANSVGLIDNDYRGEIRFRFNYIWQPEDFVVSTNHKIVGNPNLEKMYKKGDKIGQLVAEVSHRINWEDVSELDITHRGEGGFGSSDKETPIQFDEKPSNLAEAYRKANYATKPDTTYEKAVQKQNREVNQ